MHVFSFSMCMQDEKDGLISQLENMAARAETDNKRYTRGCSPTLSTHVSCFALSAIQVIDTHNLVTIGIIRTLPCRADEVSSRHREPRRNVR